MSSPIPFLWPTFFAQSLNDYAELIFNYNNQYFLRLRIHEVTSLQLSHMVNASQWIEKIVNARMPSPEFTLEYVDDENDEICVENPTATQYLDLIRYARDQPSKRIDLRTTIRPINMVLEQRNWANDRSQSPLESWCCGEDFVETIRRLEKKQEIIRENAIKTLAHQSRILQSYEMKEMTGSPLCGTPPATPNSSTSGSVMTPESFEACMLDDAKKSSPMKPFEQRGNPEILDFINELQSEFIDARQRIGMSQTHGNGESKHGLTMTMTNSQSVDGCSQTDTKLSKDAATGDEREKAEYMELIDVMQRNFPLQGLKINLDKLRSELFAEKKIESHGGLSLVHTASHTVKGKQNDSQMQTEKPTLRNMATGSSSKWFHHPDDPSILVNRDVAGTFYKTRPIPPAVLKNLSKPFHTWGTANANRKKELGKRESGMIGNGVTKRCKEERKDSGENLKVERVKPRAVVMMPRKDRVKRVEKTQMTMMNAKQQATTGHEVVILKKGYSEPRIGIARECRTKPLGVLGEKEVLTKSFRLVNLCNKPLNNVRLRLFRKSSQVENITSFEGNFDFSVGEQKKIRIGFAVPVVRNEAAFASYVLECPAGQVISPYLHLIATSKFALPEADDEEVSSKLEQFTEGIVEEPNEAFFLDAPIKVNCEPLKIEPKLPEIDPISKWVEEQQSRLSSSPIPPALGTMKREAIEYQRKADQYYPIALPMSSSVHTAIDVNEAPLVATRVETAVSADETLISAHSVSNEETTPLMSCSVHTAIAVNEALPLTTSVHTAIGGEEMFASTHTALIEETAPMMACSVHITNNDETETFANEMFPSTHATQPEEKPLVTLSSKLLTSRYETKLAEKQISLGIEQDFAQFEIDPKIEMNAEVETVVETEGECVARQIDNGIEEAELLLPTPLPFKIDLDAHESLSQETTRHCGCKCNCGEDAAEVQTTMPTRATASAQIIVEEVADEVDEETEPDMDLTLNSPLSKMIVNDANTWETGFDDQPHGCSIPADIDFLEEDETQSESSDDDDDFTDAQDDSDSSETEGSDFEVIDAEDHPIV